MKRLLLVVMVIAGLLVTSCASTEYQKSGTHDTHYSAPDRSIPGSPKGSAY